MNHQPFEEWLFGDKNLTPAEKRELDLHLRTCVHCTALSATGLALRTANVVSPSAGFTDRFQQRLAAHKIAEHRRRLWGMLVLIIGGVGLLSWFIAPYVYAFISSPLEWLIIAIGYFLFITTSILAFSQILSVLAQILPGFIPPYLWMVIISALAGLGLLWIISIWRISRISQGVSA